MTASAKAVTDAPSYSKYIAGYYSHGVVRWSGSWAEKLGVEGEVTEEALKLMIEGRHPVTGESLMPPRVSDRAVRDVSRILGVKFSGQDGSLKRWGQAERTMLSQGLDPDSGRRLGEVFTEMIAADAKALASGNRNVRDRAAARLGRRFGLEAGTVLTAEQANDVRAGFHPTTGEPLGEWVEAQTKGRIDQTNRRATTGGVDITITVPKSVSVLWAFADEDMRREIEEAIDAANAAAMAFIEDEVARVRRGREGAVVLKTNGLLVATVAHETSREGDPHLHRHNVISAFVEGEDGQVSKLHTKLLFHSSKLAGGVAALELRRQLADRLGVAWEQREDGMWELEGIPQELRREFSTRTRRMEEWIGEKEKNENELIEEVTAARDVYRSASERVAKAKREGTDPAKEDVRRARRYETYKGVIAKREASSAGLQLTGEMKEAAFIETRKAKDYTPTAELTDDWKARLSKKGLTPEKLAEAVKEAGRSGRRATARSDAAALALGGDTSRDRDAQILKWREKVGEELTKNRSTWGRRDALVAFLDHAPVGTTYDEVQAECDRWLADDAQVVMVRDWLPQAEYLGGDEPAIAQPSGTVDGAEVPEWIYRGDWVLRDGGPKYATSATLKLEEQITALAEKMLDRDDVARVPADRVREVALAYNLAPEQRTFLAQLCLSGQQISVNSGVAGAGKTHTLAAAAELWRAEGYEVWGLSTAAVAAQNLMFDGGFDQAATIAKLRQYAAGNSKVIPMLSDKLKADRDRLQKYEREMAQRHRDEATLGAGDEGLAMRHLQERKGWEQNWAKWVEQAESYQQAMLDLHQQSESFDAQLKTVNSKLDAAKADMYALSSKKDVNPRRLASARGNVERLTAERQRLIQEIQSFWKDKKRQDFSPNKQTVLVVDEAGMVNTQDMLFLIELAEAHGMKLVLTGDTRQLSAITTAGAFALLRKLGGATKLTKTRRMVSDTEKALTERWHRVDQITDPEEVELEAREIVSTYQREQRITVVDRELVDQWNQEGQLDDPTLPVAEAQREVARQLMLDWWTDRRQQPDASVLMQAYRRDDVRRLNEMAQQKMIAEGKVDTERQATVSIPEPGQDSIRTVRLHEGDRVMCIQNVPGRSVKNGMVGTVEQVKLPGKKGNLEVAVRFPTETGGSVLYKFGRQEAGGRRYLDGFLDLGYASTIHKAQGSTVDYSMLLADGQMTSQELYPGMTRGRHENSMVFVADEDASRDQAVDEIVRAVSTSAAGEAALSVLSRPSPEQVAKQMEILAGVREDWNELSDDEQRVAAETMIVELAVSRSKERDRRVQAAVALVNEDGADRTQGRNRHASRTLDRSVA